MLFEPEMKTKLAREWCQELQRKAALHRMLASTPGKSDTGRHVIGNLGRALISFGTWLEHVEQRKRPVVS